MIDSIPYAILYRLAGLRHLLRQRCTAAGQVALLALVASAVLGVDTNRNLAYQLFAVLLALFVFALLGLRAARGARPTLQASRALPRFGTVGELLPYRLTIENLGASPLQGFALSEQILDPRPSLAVFRAAQRAGERPRWRWHRLCAQGNWFSAEALPLPVLAAGASVVIPTGLRPLRRGRLHLNAIRLVRPESLGLLQGLALEPCADSVLILPRRYRLPPLDLPGNRAMLQGSQAVASSVADAEEFQSLRDYRPGDPLRLIHWKSWARSGKPVIREYQDEFSLRHALVLDTFCSDAQAAVFEEAVSLAASFACTVETRESLLDLLFVGAEVYCETAGRGHGPVERLLEVLAGVQACHDKPFQRLQAAVLAQRAQLSGCICVLLAWDEARAAFVRQLDAIGLAHQVFVLTDAGRTNLAALGAAGLPAGVKLLVAGQVEQGLFQG